MDNPVIPAYAGVKAVYKHLDGVSDDIKYDVPTWWVRPTGSGAPIVTGLVVLPGFTTLVAVDEVDLPDGYSFFGYAYCP